ncbi:hypothetical protein [Paraburkholderia sp. GAS199]|uniref:hypothetical protein n=1 Tax=Paraburkholderia sp. GAS199 TaxID=3035126 RepID=UPI003D1EACF6
MVSMEPPASLEEEFNDWYDTEHFPQRRALPGFRSASRWVCLEGWPRWMALYDLESQDALHTEAYVAVSGAHSTPWSRRILPRTVGRSRVSATSIARFHANEQLTPEATARLLVASIPPTSQGESAQDLFHTVREALSVRADLLQLSGFIEENGKLWLFAAFDAPVSTASLAAQIGRPRGCGISTFNLYMPYLRSTY